MTNTTPSNAPIVPNEKPKGVLSPVGLIELRDWFAGQALAGLCAAGGYMLPDDAESAYRLADAMLAEREKRQ